jgi:hypothetical protein
MKKQTCSYCGGEYYNENGELRIQSSKKDKKWWCCVYCAFSFWQDLIDPPEKKGKRK